MEIEVNAQIPEAYGFLSLPSRYKCSYGGRGAARSWSFARTLLLQGLERPLRVLCAREFQNSIKDSVHKLLADQIDMMNLHSAYEVQETIIKGPNGTEFSFKGLRHNITGIKSSEGVDVVWVEEANTVSKASWEILIPTIRKPDSEIWLTFNPELDTDETYVRFVLSAPKNCISKRTTWRDNPWFPDVLLAEMEACKARSIDDYQTIWEGFTRKTLHGAVYAEELREAEERITRVPYNPAKPVDTYWDLGWADHVAIWFAQSLPNEFHIIDYHSDHLKKISDYLMVMQQKKYVYGKMFLPHDGDHKLLAADGRSVKSIMQASGHTVQIVPNIGVDIGIKATREVFPLCWFDGEKCADGLNALRRYRWKMNEGGQYMRTPVHDENSHGADAFRQLGVAIKAPKAKAKVREEQRNVPRDAGWMAA